MMLSRSFSLQELSKSRTALNRGWDNTPPQYAIENLILLCKNILQPIRDHFNLPVLVSSGYRGANVNRAEGGSVTSQHLVGQAADIEIPGVHNADVWQFIHDNLPYDQLIAEHLKKDNPSAGWVHVSYNAENTRKQAMSNVHGNYVKGLKYEN